MKKNIDILTVKPNSIVSIDVSGAFLNSLNGFLQSMFEELPDEEIVLIFDEIKNTDGDMKDMSQKTKNVFLIMSLINTIESEFKSSGLIIKTNVEYDADETGVVDTMLDRVYTKYEQDFRADDSNDAEVDSAEDDSDDTDSAGE